MKKFLIKLLFFSGILLIAIAVYITLLAGNDADAFYKRFTVERQSSLILGSSRAAQGIEPEILNERLNLKNGLYNYAFTVNRSTWGPPYLKSIKRKLKEENDVNNIFIIECNPWSFHSEKNSIGKFREQNASPNSILWPNMNPNLEYFFGDYEVPNLHLVILKLIDKSEPAYVNNFGRYVIKLKYDSADIIDRIKQKLNVYNKKLQNEVIDSTRFHYFNKTIQFLSKRGKVYIVRVPVSKQMLKLEEELIPNFDKRMEEVDNSRYINLKSLSNDFITTDGNHIHNKFTSEFSSILADSIVNSNY